MTQVLALVTDEWTPDGGRRLRHVLTYRLPICGKS